MLYNKITIVPWELTRKEYEKMRSLDAEELQIAKDIEAGLFVQVENFEERKKMFMEAGRNTIKKLKAEGKRTL